jgi:ubiquinone/menaquinone biosynthesis C-methylase UbiE
MSSFLWMKVLESAPERYDCGIRMLSGGRIQQIYNRIAALAATPGKRVLDIGCGTGGVSLACAARGAIVTGIDIDSGMLEVARRKPAPAAGSVTFAELGAAEIEDRFAAGSFDAAVSCLAMSEMSPDEQDYALQVANTRLAPGGVIVIADESLPDSGPSRWAYRLRRLPAAAAAYLLT